MSATKNRSHPAKTARSPRGVTLDPQQEWTPDVQIQDRWVAYEVNAHASVETPRRPMFGNLHGILRTDNANPDVFSIEITEYLAKDSPSECRITMLPMDCIDGLVPLIASLVEQAKRARLNHLQQQN